MLSRYNYEWTNVYFLSRRFNLIINKSGPQTRLVSD